MKTAKGGGGGQGQGQGQTVVRSYQRGESLGEAARPVIEHYGDDDDVDAGAGDRQQQQQQQQSFLGSATARHAPSDGINRGIANSAHGGGTTLPELVVRMRIINMTLCTMALLFEVPSFLSKALFNPPRAVLAGYLAFFAGLLCCFELHVPAIARFIRSNFGLLYSPPGRAVWLFLMGGLCVGQGGLLEMILGGIMVANGVYSLYIPCRYPGFDKAHEELGRENIMSIAAKRSAGYGAWATPEWFTDGEGEGGQATATAATTATGGERQSLMGNLMSGASAR